MRSHKYDYATIIFLYLFFAVLPCSCCSISATYSAASSDLLVQFAGIAIAMLPFGLLSLFLLTQERTRDATIEPAFNRIIRWMVEVFIFTSSVAAILKYLERTREYQQGIADLGSMSGGDLMFFLWIAGFSFGLFVLTAARSWLDRFSN